MRQQQQQQELLSHPIISVCVFVCVWSVCGVGVVYHQKAGSGIGSGAVLLHKRSRFVSNCDVVLCSRFSVCTVCWALSAARALLRTLAAHFVWSEVYDSDDVLCVLLFI